MSSSDQKRLQVVASHLSTLNLSTAEIRRLSYAISSRGRFRATNGKSRTVQCPSTDYAYLGIKIGRVMKKKAFHRIQGAAFPHLCGRLTAQRHTWDHISNDREKPAYMYAENLRPASVSEQNLNRTTSDNPVEGRPVGSLEPWRRFRNPGRAAQDLARLMPGKKFNRRLILHTANQRQTQHLGWEFRWPEGSVQVRTVSSSPSEPQWRDDGDFADEEWARFETLADGRLRVTPEFRDGTLGKTFVCEI